MCRRDAVSKQPHYKYAALQMRGIAQPETSEPKRSKYSSLRHTARHVYEKAAETSKPPRQHVQEDLRLLEGSEQALAEDLDQAAEPHMSLTMLDQAGFQALVVPS